MNSKIPKILHLYWGKNKPLSYMKYLTAVSFSKLNPDWEIVVYYPTNICKDVSWDTEEHKFFIYNGKDWFTDLKNIKNLSLKEVDFQLTKEISEVHKSDLIRLNLLSTIGGVWSDFDIFYIKPIESMFLNKEEKDTFICYNYGYHSIGFLASSENNLFWKETFGIAVRAINGTKKLEYQNLGKDLYNYFFKYNPKNVSEFNDKYNVNIVNIPFTTVYPFDWKQIDLIFGDNSNLFENTIGIHWFAGNKQTSEIENIVTEQNIGDFKNKFLLNLMSKFNEI